MAKPYTQRWVLSTKKREKILSELLRTGKGKITEGGILRGELGLEPLYTTKERLIGLKTKTGPSFYLPGMKRGPVTRQRVPTES